MSPVRVNVHSHQHACLFNVLMVVVVAIALFGCPRLPTAEFNTGSYEGVRPFDVAFQDLSNGNGKAITGWMWDFGDGGRSLEQHPLHTYTSEGKYTVSLTVTTANGSDEIVKENLITVEMPFVDEDTDFDAPAGVTAIEIEDGVEVDAAVGELLISVKRDITEEEMNALLDQLAEQGLRVVGYSADARLLQTRSLDKSTPQFSVIQKLESLELVTSAGPNTVVDLDQFTVAVDNYAGWELYWQTPEVSVPANLMCPDVAAKLSPVPESFTGDYWMNLIRAPEAWDIHTGASTVTIGIVDNGIVPGTVIDAGRLSTFYSDGTAGSDTADHGTMVAALAAGNGGDTTSDAVGVAWTNPVTFVTYKKSILGLFFITDIVGGIIQAVDQNAKVINLSAGPGPLSENTIGSNENFLIHRRKFREQMTSTVDYARRKDVLVCFSAGNDGFAIDANHVPAIDRNGDGDADDAVDRAATTTLFGTPNFVPGATVRNDDQLLPTHSGESSSGWDTNALIVGAAGAGAANPSSATFADQFVRVGSSSVYQASSDYSTGMIGQFSRLGAVVNLVAPGVEVSYGATPESGTSFAAPLVTGAAALLFGINPDLAAVEVRRILLDSANDVPFQGRGVEVGRGLLDVAKAAELAESSVTVPVHPTVSAVLRKNQTTSATVNVTVPEEGVQALDVVILTDISGSYFDDIDTLKSKAEDVVTALAGQVADVQFGLASFSDFPIAPYGSSGYNDEAYFLDQRITNDLPAFFSAVDGLDTLFGDDGPESQLEALYQLATGAGRDLNADGDYTDTGDIAPMNIGWRPGALRLVILSTDASFHNSDAESTYPGAGFAETLSALDEADIMVLGLYSSVYAQGDIESVTNATHGAALPLESDSGNIVQAISDALDVSFRNVTVSIEVLNDPEGFVQSPELLVLDDVTLGESVEFELNLKGVLSQSLTPQRFNIRAWALVNESGLIMRIPISIEVPSIFDF